MKQLVRLGSGERTVRLIATVLAVTVTVGSGSAIVLQERREIAAPRLALRVLLVLDVLRNVPTARTGPNVTQLPGSANVGRVTRVGTVRLPVLQTHTEQTVQRSASAMAWNAIPKQVRLCSMLKVPPLCSA